MAQGIINNVITENALSIPTTTSTVGQIIQNNVILLHTFGSDNLFIGTPSGQAGNFTLTGTDNIGIGASVFQALTSGTGNFAFGTNSLNALQSGSNNVALGVASLQGVVSGIQNTGVGTASVRRTTGSNNIGIGYQAYQGAVGTTTGSGNIVIGAQSGSSYVGAESNNIIIGTTVAGTAAESNKLRIGNGTGTGTGQLNKAFISGIYNTAVTSGNSPGVMLADNANQIGSLGAMTNGQLVIGSTGATPVVAAVTGGNNVTVTNGAGSISLAASNTKTAAFIAYVSSTITDVTGDDTNYTIVFDSTKINVGSGFNTGTGIFTAPVTGNYMFTANISFLQLDAASYTYMFATIQANGVDYFIWESAAGSGIYTGGAFIATGSVVVPLSATQTAKVIVAVGSSTKSVDVRGGANGDFTSFSGYLL